MSHLLSVFFAIFFPTLALASEDFVDARNTAEYHVLFDLGAHGKTEVANGYGAYVQIYENSGEQWVRYCENFEQKGLSGKPNFARDRFKLLPFGVVDDTAYHCRDYTLELLAKGQPIIRLGDHHLFAVKSAFWSKDKGGELLFQMAKKFPLVGKPVYRTLRIRATRVGSSLEYNVETVLPDSEAVPTHYFEFEASAGPLGLPNGIVSVTVNPLEATEKSLDMDALEGPIEIHGDGRGIPHPGNPEFKKRH